jgi:hypothetical protein
LAVVLQLLRVAVTGGLEGAEACLDRNRARLIEEILLISLGYSQGVGRGCCLL